jgi:hypothetical protein
MKNRIAITLLFNVCIALWTAPVHAGPTLKDYEELKENKYFLAHLHGIGVGYSWANTYLSAIRKSPPLYCEPEKVALNADNYFQILDEYIKKQGGILQQSTSISMLLLYALREALPCN